MFLSITTIFWDHNITNGSNDLTFAMNYINYLHDLPILQKIEMKSIFGLLKNIFVLSLVIIFSFDVVIDGNKYNIIIEWIHP